MTASHALPTRTRVVLCAYYTGSRDRPSGGIQAEPVAAAAAPPIVPAPRLAPTEATRPWAALLPQIVEVDPLVCPTCRGSLRIISCFTHASVIDQILTRLRARAAREAHAGPRRPPSTRAPTSRVASRGSRPPAAPTAPCARPRLPATTRGSLAWAAVTPVRQIGPRWPRPLLETAGRTADEARDRVCRHAAARRSALARAAIGPYT